LSCQALFGVDEGDPAETESGAGGAGGSDAGPGNDDCALCVEPPPAGWLGPAYLYTSAPTDAFTCPNVALATTFWQGEPPPDFTCTACSCGAPTGVSCGAHPLSCYAAGCSGASSWSGAADDCQYVGTFGACSVGPSPVVSGQCAAAGGVPSGASWQLAHHLCDAAAQSATCADGDCYAGPGEPPPSRMCVLAEAEGHQACPAGWDEPPIHAWTGQSDTRTCGCTCSPAAGTCTGGGYALSTQPFTCDLAPLIGPGQCQTMGGATYANWKSPETIDAACAASGGTPSGAFVGVGPRTLCCRAWP
jgi:hypothetical protein